MNRIDQKLSTAVSHSLALIVSVSGGGSLTVFGTIQDGSSSLTV